MGLVLTVGFEPTLHTLSKCSLYQLGYASMKSRRRESNPVGLAYDASALTVEHRRHGLASRFGQFGYTATVSRAGLAPRLKLPIRLIDCLFFAAGA